MMFIFTHYFKKYLLICFNKEWLRPIMIYMTALDTLKDIRMFTFKCFLKMFDRILSSRPGL